jgi:hypothetical protein
VTIGVASLPRTTAPVAISMSTGNKSRCHCHGSWCFLVVHLLSRPRRIPTLGIGGESGRAKRSSRAKCKIFLSARNNRATHYETGLDGPGGSCSAPLPFSIGSSSPPSDRVPVGISSLDEEEDASLFFESCDCAVFPSLAAFILSTMASKAGDRLYKNHSRPSKCTKHRDDSRSIIVHQD